MARCKTYFMMAALLFGSGAMATPARVQAETCSRCGCECAVCRPHCGTRTETETEYSCECEDFCVPGEVTHEGCCSSCDGGSCGGSCFSLFGVRIYTRKKLMVREVTREVPTTEYEVEYLCPRCASCDSCGGGSCDHGVPAVMPYSAPRSGPPAPVRIQDDASASRGAPVPPPAAAAPQPRASLLESLLDFDR